MESANIAAPAIAAKEQFAKIRGCMVMSSVVRWIDLDDP
jgi:hypothetical protein